MESKEQLYKRLQDKLIQSEKGLEKAKLNLQKSKRQRIDAEKKLTTIKNKPEFANHNLSRLDKLISQKSILSSKDFLGKLKELKNEIAISIVNHYNIKNGEDNLLKSVLKIIND